MELEEALKKTFKDKYFFTKYPELVNGKDVGKESFPFVEGGYDSQTIVSETMRFFPVASLVGSTFFVPSQAPKEQMEEWFKLGIPKINLREYDNDNPDDYEHQINLLPQNSLVVLHPYSKISKNIFAIDPNIHFNLNNKFNLSEITSFAPCRKSLSISELVNTKPPFVVKKVTGSSGDGVRIVRDYSQIKDLESFLSGDDFFIEEYINYTKNCSLQFLIDQEKNIYFVGHGEQNTTESGEFQGVVSMLTGAPSQKLLDVGFEACNNVAKKGYSGFLGFDILEDKQGSYYIIDPNIRCTAATPAYLLKDKLSKILGPFVYTGSSRYNARDPNELIGKIKNSGGLLLSMSHLNNGYYKFFGMFGGESPIDAIGNWNKFQAKINK